MRIVKILTYLALLFVCSVGVANAQDLTITGTVMSEFEEPVVGATVFVDGTSNVAMTELDGTYTISNVPTDATLKFSCIGMTEQTILVNGKTVINAIMQEEAFNLEELIVVGYGTVKKSDLTGSVGRVGSETFENQSLTQVSDALSGKVTGLFVSQGTDASGGGGSMQMRGKSSILANSSPLVVLDGVIYNGSMEDINPADVSTMDVLKDASSAAVYGSRAAAGVILITTKKGKSGAPKLRFNTSVGFSSPANDLKPYSASEYITYRQDYLRLTETGAPAGYYDNPNSLSAGISLDSWRAMNPTANADDTREFLGRLSFVNEEVENYINGNTTDWYDEAYRTGIRQNYDLSVSGANDVVSYYMSLGYVDNQGYILGDDFESVRAKVNLGVNVTDFLKLGANIQYSNKSKTGDAVDVGLTQSKNIYNVSPYASMYEEDGSLALKPADMFNENPMISYYMVDRYKKSNNLFAVLDATLTLPFGISYQLSFQPRFDFTQNYEFSYTANEAATGERVDSTNYGWMVDNLLKWNKTFGKHNFDATFLFNSEKSQMWKSQMNNTGFIPNENLGYHGLQYGTSPTLDINDTYVSGNAYMARLNYTYDYRYLLTLSVRKDGYSAFGQKNKTAVFPAAAFAWQIANEDFFDVNWIDQLKLRLSWGSNGNRDIPIYSSLSQLGINYYNNGSSSVIGVDSSTLPNNSLMWESTESMNIGFDLNMFDNRVTINADAYMKTTTDLLMNRTLPITTGYTKTSVNLGEISNKGLELTVSSLNVDNKNFKWNTNFTFSTNKNKLIELYNEEGEYTILNQQFTGEQPDLTNGWFPGYSLTQIWDYNIIGVWQEEEAEEAAKYGLKPGDYKVEDVNGDYKYTQEEDKQFIGYNSPRASFGLVNSFTLWKNLTFSFFLRADVGHMADYYPSTRPKATTAANCNFVYSPYWTPENRNNEWQSLSPTSSLYEGSVTGRSTKYFSKSFLRVQDISVSYNLPSKWTKKVCLSNARFFGSVRNAYCFNQWPGYDPESGMSAMPRVISFGLSLGL